MGNPDLVIIFNDMKTFVIKGQFYDERHLAIKIAMQEWINYWEKVREYIETESEKSFKEIPEIQTIRVYELSEE